MNHSQTDTLIAAWRENADTARKAGHEQTAREIEAAAGLFERQAAEIKTLRENNAALQAELDDGHAELREERDALAAWKDDMVTTLDAPVSPERRYVHARTIAPSAPRASLARRDARMKAEALEDQASEMIAMNDERDMCSVHGAARHLQSVAAEYREQAEGEL